MNLDDDLPEMGSPTQLSAAQHEVSTTASTASETGLADSSHRRNPLHHSASVPVNSTFKLPATLQPTPPSAVLNNYEKTDRKLGSNEQSRPIQSTGHDRSIDLTQQEGMQGARRSKAEQLGVDNDRPPRAAPGISQLVDWSAPGGALHAHLTSNKPWSTGQLR